MSVEVSVPPARVAIVTSDDAAALAALVRALPPHPGYAIIVAYSGAADLTALLRPLSPIPVVDVEGEIGLEPDHLYVVPTDHDARVVDDHALIIDRSVRTRGAVDKLLRSAADALTTELAAVILPASSTDGALGIKQVKETGGMTIAQLPADDHGAQLPRAAIATGFVDLVLAGPELVDRLAGFARVRVDRTDLSPEETFRDILAMVRVRTGHDFSAYKRATLYRRIARRMQVCQCETLPDYQRHLRAHSGELGNLLRDFLISVTSFFRDPEAFDTLAQITLPRLFAGRGPGEQIRVWTAGCATGEEAYSLAILLAEHAARTPSQPQLQIFATDIDEEALAEARAGRYLEAIATDVSPERLQRFFTWEPPYYRVSRELRELVLFSPHNLLRDPPFSRLDLITCRNLLIYLDRDAQDRVLNTFHFALRPEGALFLGSSESAETTAVQFAATDAKHRLFARRQSTSNLAIETVAATAPPPATIVSRAPIPTERASSLGELHHRLVEQYAPPSMLVSEELEILHVSQHAGRFLLVSGGEPTRQLMRLVLPELRLELRTSIYAARQHPRGDVRTVRFIDGERSRSIELRTRVLDLPEGARGITLIMFDELPAGTDDAAGPEAATAPAPAFIEPVVREMEDHLQRTRDQLRTTVEQYETSLEELQASNEELQAINEELRSATEELETSKEELQSVNEELTTLNHELKLKVDEVSHANSDLQNLISSTDIAVVFLDRALHVKRYTKRALDLFNIIPSDIGRPLAHLTHHLDCPDLPGMAASVLQHLRTIEQEVRSDTDRRYLTRLLPYRSLDDRIEGVVLTFVDVTDLHDAVEGRRRSEAALLRSQERLQLALGDTPLVLLTLDRTLELSWGYVRGAELAPTTASLHELFAGDGVAQFLALAREVMAGRVARRVELELVLDRKVRTYEFRVEPTDSGVSAVGFDVTSSKHAQATLIDSDRRKDEFLATLSHELRNPLTPLRVALDIAKLSTAEPAQLASSLAIMERQVVQLSQLVDELLDLSRVTQGKIELDRSELDPALVVEAALESTRPLLQQRNHELEVALPPPTARINGDHARLTQVLTNLLTNAAKYTPEGGRIELQLEADATHGLLVTRVRDNGVGIPADMLSRIFDIFVQCRDERGRAQGGLGIGLNLVRRLVELHGGKVSASSNGTGLGSEFVIQLPLVKV